MGKRKKLSKNVRERGLPPTSRLLTTYEVGQKIAIKIDPSIQKGAPHHRFHGMTGKIIKPQGNAYVVKVKDGNKFKKVIARPEHLRPLEE
ncbi:MAG: 50S ribosomal protein L21e [Candidatus Korarchaeota archaeon]|nr:50S ribosomal protein L21e [Candidatus Korarchaeota archaeon]NIU85510.1 50S ribosomal protein L21e [Candidatus Thorarchaeota archaeon]NIW15627.1 50S ribosomal protein L21e [Candidatus Thorarchaeota archaeon]NIW53558.1 50S ribosomal protein L21e [Candidatus Korarchaeota archaeon]